MAYEVQGQKYTLPPPSLTKPLESGGAASGVLDTWPAHASGRNVPNTQMLFNKEGRLIVAQDDNQMSLVPKPKFLEQLEGYLRRELQTHNVTVIEANTIRLQIHREIFEYIIEAFKTYKPLLAAIKREYEMMIAHLREEIRRMEPMKEMLWTLSQECDQRIMAMREEEKDDIRELKDLNQVLRKRLDDQRESAKDLETQVERLQEEVATAHRKWRDEADSRSLLAADLNELRAQQEELSLFASSKNVDNDGEDPVQLRIGLEQARKAQAELVTRLTHLESDYADVVPRRDFEALQKEHVALVEEHARYKLETDRLVDEHRVLQETYDEVLKQRDQYYTEAESLRRSATPRPDWEKCGDYLPGGPTLWQEASGGKSSEELLDMLLQEMSGQGTTGGQMLEPFGTGPEIPKFLHHDSPVSNRRMTKRDTRIHVREIWDNRKKEKDEQTLAQEKGETMTLSLLGDFLDIFFRKTYGINQIRIEWAYSFMDALARFGDSDERCGQFLGVLKGDVSEELYWDEMRMLGRLMDGMKSKDPDNSGFIEKADLLAVLHEFFPGSEEEKLVQMTETAKVELETPEEITKLEYEKLFMSDDEGEFGAFLKEIRSIAHDEKEKYIEEIRKELVDITTDDLTAEECRRAFSIVDPSIDKTQLNTYLFWIFNTQDLSTAVPIPVDVVCQRMRSGVIKRVGKRL